MTWEHGFNRWFVTGAAAVAAVLALVIWRYQAGPVVIPYGHPQAARQFHRKLPPPSAVTAANVVGGPGEEQPVRRIRANHTATVARLVLQTLGQATPVQAHVATPPSFGDYTVQLTLANGEAITVEPAAYYHGSAMHLVPGLVSYGISTHGGNGVRTTVVKDVPLYQWLTFRRWSKDLKSS